MQTFLPYESFHQSVTCLDSKRLGKQRVEAQQILNTLTGQSTGWRNHPAVRMWAGYEDALRIYTNICIREWIARGYKNTMQLHPMPDSITWPIWVGRADFHSSHRSNLLRKDPIWYGRYGWMEPSDLPYVWPID